MDNPKTKSIRGIEEKMRAVDENSVRYRVLDGAKNFKTSWVQLGQALYTVWKDKLFKEWGYGNFDIYTSKEIGIRKHTAMKLLRSYYFLEKEEPAYLHREYVLSAEASCVPGLDSVDVLRLAKNKKELGQEDYDQLKNEVFRKGRDAGMLKKDLTSLIRQREELDPQEAWKRKKIASVKRAISLLKSLKKEIELSRMLPSSFIGEIEELVTKLETEIS